MGLEEEINKPFNKRLIRKYEHRITVPTYGYLSIDLLDMSNLSKKLGNKRMNWILVAVDIFSRYAWLFPLKNKTTEHVVESIQKLNNLVQGDMEKYSTKNVHGQKAIYEIMSDAGVEFKGQVDAFLKKQGIRHRVVDVGDHKAQAIVERLNQSIRLIFRNIFARNNNFVWYPEIANVASFYNNRFHSGINAKPVDVWRGKDIPNVEEDGFVNDLNLGDSVRVLLKRTIFTKQTAVPQYSKNVYRVEKRDGNKYRLEGREGRYARWQLLKTEASPNQNLGKDLHTEHQKILEKRRIQRELKRDDIDPKNIVMTNRRRLRERPSQVPVNDAPKKKEPKKYEAESIIADRKNAQGEIEYEVKWVGYDETTWEPASNLKGTTLIKDWKRENS